MAEIRIACPVCQSSIRVAEHMQGQSVHCPKCLSVVSLTKRRPKQEEDDDLAMPVEANYDLPESPDDLQSDSPIPCPSCGKVLPPKAKFCTKCGYHLAMETHFDDLIEENIHRQEAPKTKAEQWLERNLDERATPRDVLIWSGACTAIVAVLMMLYFRSYSVTGGTLFGIFFAVGLGVAWFFGMRYLGLLEDPKRGERLASESSGTRQKPGGKLFGGKRETEGFSPWEKDANTAPPGTYHPKPIEEKLSLDDDDEDLATPVETPAPSPKKQTTRPLAGQGGKSPQSATPQSAAPRREPPKQPPASKPSENKEDWLDFFDDQQDRK